jgi:hypothetical protein
MRERKERKRERERKKREINERKKTIECIYFFFLQTKRKGSQAAW